MDNNATGPMACVLRTVHTYSVGRSVSVDITASLRERTRRKYGARRSSVLLCSTVTLPSNLSTGGMYSYMYSVPAESLRSMYRTYYFADPYPPSTIHAGRVAKVPAQRSASASASARYPGSQGIGVEHQGRGSGYSISIRTRIRVRVQ